MSSQNSAPGPPPGPRIAFPHQQRFRLRTRRPDHPPPVQPSPFAVVCSRHGDPPLPRRSRPPTARPQRAGPHPRALQPLCPRRYRLRPLSLHAEPAKRLRRVGQMQRPSKPDTPQVPPRSPASTAFSPRFSPSLKKPSPPRPPVPHRAATPPSTPVLRPRARPPRRPRTSPRFSPPMSWPGRSASPRPAPPAPTAPGTLCSGSRPSSPAAPSPNRATSSAPKSSSAAAPWTRTPSSASRATWSAPATSIASSNPSTSRMFKTLSTPPALTRPRSGCPNTAPAHRRPATNLAVWPRCLDAGLPEGRPQVRNLSSNGKTYDGECGVPCNKLGVAVVDSADLHSG
jgi:hypothetical protein